jgi:predicted amidophosphoribosyltransferase
MSFCPNCSFFFGAEEKTYCPKCGVDVAVMREERARRKAGPADSLKEWVKENPELTPAGGGSSAGVGNPGSELLCPQCGKTLQPHPDDAYSFDLLGGDVNVSDVDVMSMVIRKRAVTQVMVEFSGWVCPEGHRFFTDFREVSRELCPACRGAMTRFGTTVLTCKRCGINLTKEKFAKMAGRQLLEEEGWRYMHR